MSGRKEWIFSAALVGLALAGMLALWRSTPHGLGLVNDSATYIEGATRLLEGKGYVRISGGGEIKPITHFPPLFSLLLAGFGTFGSDLLHAARLLVTFLFGVDILLVGVSVYRISRSMVFACLGALLLAVSDLHLGVYSFALSEPLFITLMLAAYLCLGKSFDANPWFWLLLAGFLLSLATLTRFAGASLFMTALLMLLLLRPPSTLKRLGAILAGALPAILTWQVYSLSASEAGSLGNRLLLWHPPSVQTLFEAVKNLLTWTAPGILLSASPVWGRLLSLVSLLVVPGLLAGLFWMLRQRNMLARQPGGVGSRRALAFTHALHVPLYLGFLVISLTIFDASTPLNDRILSVIYIPELILFASALAWVWSRLHGRPDVLRWSVAASLVLLVAFSLKDGYAAVGQLGREGQGFAHREISDSPAIQAIHQMPPTILYSNKPGAIFLLTGRSAYVIPTPGDPVTGQARSDYAEDLSQMQQRVSQGEAVLVLFGLRNSQDPAEVDLFNDLTAGLSLRTDYGEIIIFGVSP
jgi:hypothetical protein